MEQVLDALDEVEGCEVPRTKTCPQCGQVLFEDMDICYGCLYDFSRSRKVPSGLPEVMVDDAEPLPQGASLVGQVGAVDRWRDGATALGEQGLALFVQTGDVDVVVPLPRQGLLVGRMPTNDVVLHSRAVSALHARISYEGDGALVEDCGATNPIVLKGREVVGSRHLSAGDTINVCGTLMTLVSLLDDDASEA